jgi:hypothetical protein
MAGMSEKRITVALFFVVGCVTVAIAVLLFCFAREPVGGWDRGAYYEDSAKIFGDPPAEVPAENP